MRVRMPRYMEFARALINQSIPAFTSWRTAAAARHRTRRRMCATKKACAECGMASFGTDLAEDATEQQVRGP